MQTHIALALEAADRASGHTQTKPSSQRWSFGSSFGLPVLAVLAVVVRLAARRCRAGRCSMRVAAASGRRAAGRCGSGTRARATRSSQSEPLVPPIGMRAELARAADVLVLAGARPGANIASGQREQREAARGRRDRGEWGREPHGDSLACPVGISREPRRDCGANNQSPKGGAMLPTRP